jgi:hypothetical protein
MALVGLLLCLFGFGLSVGGLALTVSVAGRMSIALIGIGISLVGMIGFVNRAYLKKAVWRREG